MPKKKKIPLEITSKKTKRKAGRVMQVIASALFKWIRRKSYMTDAELEKAMESRKVKGTVE